MIIIPHLLVGAAIGAKIRGIGWIIILGLLSHAAIDRIPHWAYIGNVLKKFQKNKSYKTLFIFSLKLIADGLIGLLIVASVMWYKNMIKLEYLIPVLIGAFSAILPDILLGIFILSYIKNKKPSKNFVDFYRDTVHHVRKHIKKHEFNNDNISTLITISLGISSYPEDSIENKKEIIKIADKRLYKAKKSGRNKTVYS